MGAKGEYPNSAYITGGPLSWSVEKSPSNAKLALPGRKRPFPPDPILLNSYLPPRGSALAMEEVTAPGPDDIKLILHR